MEESIWLWLGFLIVIAVLLVIDLGVFNRKNTHISVKKALELTAFWISLGLLFGVFVFFNFGADSATDYYAAYIVEKAMSVDNIFVFIIIFAYFKVPDEYQHKALFYGIIGAIVFRFIFIFLGVELLNKFDFMMIIFGILLIYLAITTVRKKETDESKVVDNFMMRFCLKFMKVHDECVQDKFFIRNKGVLMATPLFIAVVALESTDLIFALDSVPAVLAITRDPFIAYTSNIFAILGLRSLYFALRGVVSSLSYLKYGLGFILAFVGMKMILGWEGIGIHISVGISLIVIISTLAVTIVVSMYDVKRKRLNEPV